VLSYTECDYDECHYAECHCAECRSAECRVLQIGLVNEPYNCKKSFISQTVRHLEGMVSFNQQLSKTMNKDRTYFPSLNFIL
jgi:hypothetical protein